MFDTAQLYGTISRDGYRSEDDVRAIAGGDAAVDPSACTQELTQYGGQLAYRVRFAAAGGEYCYTIAARTGEILDVQRPEQPAQMPDTPATPGKPDDSAAPAGSEISISEAMSRVLQKLGISRRTSATSMSSVCRFPAAMPTTSPSRRTENRIRFM